MCGKVDGELTGRAQRAVIYCRRTGCMLVTGSASQASEMGPVFFNILINNLPLKNIWKFGQGGT